MIQQSGTSPAQRLAHGASPDVWEAVLAPCGISPNKVSCHVRLYALGVCVCGCVGVLVGKGKIQVDMFPTVALPERGDKKNMGISKFK